MKTFTAVLNAKGLTLIESENTDNAVREGQVPNLEVADKIIAAYRLRRLEEWEIRYEPDARFTLTARCVRLPEDF